jgi:hypothetical protein
MPARFRCLLSLSAPPAGVAGLLWLVAAAPAFAQQGGAIQLWNPQGDPSSMAAVAASVRNERLVPAAMNVLTDKLGNSWNIEQNGTLGRVGNSMINSGLTLLINNQQFYTYQPMMTADGAEYVLPSRANSSLPGLQILRRIRVMEREGALRFLEVLTNGNSNPLTVSVVLRTNFSGNYKTYITDQGNSGVVTLGPREGAILVTPGSNQSNRAFLFTLSGQKSAIKPTITSQNKYGLTFQYNLTIPPGQTVAIAHAVAQVPVPREFDRQTLARVFRPLALDRLAGSVPQEFRALLANGEGAGGLSGGLSTTGATLESRLGVERGRRDILAMGDRTRLVGTAAAARIAITTPYGGAEVPLDQIAAIVGGNGGRRDGARIFLRDSQAFSGEIVAEELRFAMASGGRMNLQIENLDRLVLAKADSDGQWAPETLAMVETHAGDRLAATRDSAAAISLRGMTPWGPLSFSLDDIVWLSPMEDEPVGHFVEFKNGTRCFLFLSGATLPLQSAVFGPCELESGQVRAIVTRAALDRAEAEREGKTGALAATDAVSSPHILAAGGQRIVGAVASETFQVLTQSETVTVTPQEIRRMINLTAADGLVADAAGPYFRLELWGGGVLTGYLAEREVAMEVRGEPWRMPLADVRELVTPVPHLTEAAQQDIARLIKELGDDVWQTREKATEELQGFGFLAQSILREELKTNPDPEVRRRLERVLAGID